MSDTTDTVGGVAGVMLDAPSDGWPDFVTVTVHASDVTDVDGNTVKADYAFSFSTVDPEGLSVIETEPADGAAGVNVDETVTITFNEPVTLNARGVSVVNLDSDTGDAVSFTVEVNNEDDTQLLLTPQDSWPVGKLIVTVDNDAVTDNDGNTMASDFWFRFSTMGYPVSNEDLTATVSSNTAGGAVYKYNLTIGDETEPIDPRLALDDESQDR